MRRFAYLTAVLALVTTTFAAGFPVFKILRANTYHVAGGTAFTVTYKGKTYMVSNWHVCRNFEKTEAKNEDKGFSYTAKVLKAFPTSDLCLLSTEQTSGIEIGKDLEVGMPVYVAGYPQYSTKLQLRKGHTTKLESETLDFGGGEKECPPGFQFEIKADDKNLTFDSTCKTRR